MAVKQAIDTRFDDPDDYHIGRELEELRPLVLQALAQSEPQGASDEDVLRCLADVADECILIDHPKDVVAAGRQLLARWGHPAIEPVPVAERLPGPEDCDKEGCCWWWDYGQDSWSQGMPEYCINRHTHWLPHYALPVPQQEVK
jgi:hypothetical protein